MTSGLSNKSAVKTFAKSKNIRVSEEFYAQLDANLEELLEKAIIRVIANHRTTLLKQDL